MHYLQRRDDRLAARTSTTSARKVTPRTKAIVVINPNNPTGAVYTREVLQGIAEIAREHSLLLLSDEIYDRILFDDAAAHPDRDARPRPAVPHLQRAVQDLPRRRLPVGLAGDHRAQAATPRASSRASSSSPRRACAPTSPPSTRCRRRCRGCSRSRRSSRPTGRLHEQRMPRGGPGARSPASSCVKPAGRAVRVPAARPRGPRDPRRRQARATTSSSPSTSLLVQGTGFNWPDARPPADRDAARGARAYGGDRAARQLPGVVQAVTPRVQVEAAPSSPSAARDGARSSLRPWLSQLNQPALRHARALMRRQTRWSETSATTGRRPRHRPTRRTPSSSR